MRVDRLPLAIDAGGFQLPASWWLPESPRGLVISLQPNELDQLVPRDGQLLEALYTHGFAVLPVGLLTPSEETSVELATTRRFDVDCLAERAVHVVDWVLAQRLGLPIGVLAKGTAAAAALIAATRRSLGAIVSLAGRPDLAASALPRVQTPTLLLAGEDNVPSLSFSELGAARLYCECELQTVPGSGLLDRPAEALAAATLALRWFGRHLVAERSQHETSTVRTSAEPCVQRC